MLTHRVSNKAFVAGTSGKTAKVAGTRAPLSRWRIDAVPEPTIPGSELAEEDAESELLRKRRVAQDLREQEKFMMMGSGDADCISCGYHYDPKVGDPDYPVAKGTKWQQLPADWQCPVCGAEKRQFQVQEKEIAGFAVNQGYGLGTNSMTGGEKSALIYGSLLVFFLLFLLGYFME